MTFRPCVSMEVESAKASFVSRFDLERGGALLEECGLFTEVRHSPRLRLLKTYGEVEALLFENGEVTAKPFKDKEDAYRFLKTLGRLLWGAQICPVSGRVVEGCGEPECKDDCWARESRDVKLKDEVENAGS